MRTIKRNSGQYIPISAMIMFTMVVFMVAIVNVYKVTRAKLKVQNIADAAALNLASQEAQAFNIVSDRNEWLNHMIAGVPSPSDPTAASDVQDCSVFNMQRPTIIPGISCVENNISWKDRPQEALKRHIFHSKEGATNYAALIQTVNEAQLLFIQAYNSFLGARGSGTGSASSTAGPTNFIGLLKHDIPDLNDPKIHLIAWNRNGAEPSVEDARKLSSGNLSSNMEGMRFRVHHDIPIQYFIKRCVPILGCKEDADARIKTMGDLVWGENQAHPGVGWLVPDWTGSPQISIQNASGPSGNHVGVGVLVTGDVTLPIVGQIPVSAKSKAYMVQGSGQSGDESGGIPRFKPTYWAKLAK